MLSYALHRAEPFSVTSLSLSALKPLMLSMCALEECKLQEGALPLCPYTSETVSKERSKTTRLECSRWTLNTTQSTRVAGIHDGHMQNLGWLVSP